ncbi:MAG: DUF1802 family protein [Cyanobacteria bacterium J06635_1]
MSQLQTALKEWSVAVNALAQGETILLLRKGGIREQGGRFSVATQHVLLYPTYEHQKKHLLKADYAHRVEPVEPGWHPQTVSLNAWANITDVLQLGQVAPGDLGQQMNDLLAFHIWNPTFVTERLRWKTGQPLYVLLLRVYRLSDPVELTWLPQYGGCRSWLTLARPVQTKNSVPVLTQDVYQQKVQQIRAALDNHQILKNHQT